MIGGPIFIMVGGGTLETWHRDLDAPSGPWYVQYFGYSHWNPPILSTIPKTQDASAFVPLQPEGTDLLWLVPSPLDSPELSATGQDPHFINLFAEGPSEPVEVRCLFDLEFTGMHGDVASNSGWDDTSQTKVVGEEYNMTSKITAHQPSVISSKSSIQYAPAHPPTDASCGLKDQLTLVDQLGHPMPAVWIQERFNPATLPPGWVVNNWQKSWITLKLPPSGLLPGDFDGIDDIWYVWPGPAPFQTFSQSQQYWAATRLIGLTDPGMYLETWQIGLAPGNATHSK